MLRLPFLALVLLNLPPIGKTQDLASIFNFEAAAAGLAPYGWGVSPPGAAVIDKEVVHGGAQSARIDRAEGDALQFSGISRGGRIEFSGKQIEMRAYLRTQDVTGWVGLWLREDGAQPSLAFNNMQNRQLKGTTDWQQYTFVLPLHPEANQFVYGVFVLGTGTVWVDDVELLVDGKPFWEAPHATIEPTVLDTDTAFTSASGIALNSLSEVQLANLVRLGKVWGFLKYHHPAVTSGKRQWDFDLFRVMPSVLAAPDRTAANAAMLKWVTGLGDVPACNHCAALPADGLALRPELDWIKDKDLLGAGLSDALQNVYRNRVNGKKQFYVSLQPGADNPKFEHELSYPRMQPADSGYQILAAFRFWNVVEYWSPNRNTVGGDWDAALRQTLPKIALAKTHDDYARELMALIALDHDTHANLWGSINVRPPTGACRLPIVVRFAENQPVVTAYLGKAPDSAALQIGDVITELDGVPVSTLVETWTPYYAGSNQAARLRDMGQSFTRGACGDAQLRISRGAENLAVPATRLPIGQFDLTVGATHDLPGEPFRLLSKDVAYLKLSTLKNPHPKDFVAQASGTKGWIIDIRNYPSEFLVFSLGSLLVDHPTEFVDFTFADPANPGAFTWGTPLAIQPAQPHYSGKIVILVDEVTQSSAEYHAMAFRAAPGAKVIGSTTAGADGNVSQFPLPGAGNTMISGLGIFYPDKRPTQRVGIVPDIVVTPTIAGIRARRDEVLETALREILGRDVSPDEVKAMLKQ